MTTVHVPIPVERSNEERWEEWRDRYAASDRRTTAQMKWIAAIAGVAALAWLVTAVV
jgi:hypothetical protein